MEKLGWRDRRISPDSGSLFQTFLREKLGGGFCYLNVVLAGLASESDYWIGLALSWIEQGGAEASDLLLARLKGVVEGRSANQKNRHKAFSVLRKIGG
ncbi:hypothetical protein I5E48_09800 [Pseudomonas aeruginosa]|nr:hypothetical protein [Pseudomonas aeruginosa]